MAYTTESVPRTDLEETRRRFDEGSAIFVDVRAPEAYQEGHIPGALSIPVAGDTRGYFALPRDRDIVLY